MYKLQTQHERWKYIARVAQGATSREENVASGQGELKQGHF